MRGNAVEVLRRLAEVMRRRPAVMISFIVGQFFPPILAGDELDVVDQQQVGVAQPPLESDRVVFLQRWMNSTMNFSADIDTTRAPRL